MEIEYHSIGEVLPDLAPSNLVHEQARRLLDACLRHPAFEVVELRRLASSANDLEPNQITDGIVVDCCDGTVPSRSKYGIDNRERLMLAYRPTWELPYDVLAMRTTFPTTAHQNHTPPDQPASLCLYFEPWSAIKRSWTPEKLLQRILWWLRETAVNTLHRSDQPLERLYFVSRHVTVLPADFDERRKNPSNVLRLTALDSKASTTVLRADFIPANAPGMQANKFKLSPLVVELPPALATRIDRDPATLGELHDQLTARGSGLVTALKEELAKIIPSAGLPLKDPNVTDVHLLLKVPVVAKQGGKPRRVDTNGFLVIGANLARLAVDSGAAFDGTKGIAYTNTNNALLANATGSEVQAPDAWRTHKLDPLDVRIAFSPQQVRRASGVPEEHAEIQGVLAGLGALGSCMAELWSRIGWGNWAFVDDDALLPHNLVRHSGKDVQIGWAKSDVVAWSAQMNWPTGTPPLSIPAKITDLENQLISTTISGAHLLVDATTTLEVPRDLSALDTSPRMASAFFTPSGRDSVLILEDASRETRLFAMEGQYYRAILNNDWGKEHLDGHHGTYWVGGGCRDISGVLSQEIVQLHGATLARQIRLLSANADPHIRVWSLSEESGAITCIDIAVEKPVIAGLGDWKIIFDDGIDKKIRKFRETALPKETGGIILGYIDQTLKTIHVVDTLPAPPDSISSETEFVRGAEGVMESIERASKLTAHIVGYVGEWHSHPPQSSALPSHPDIGLVAYLANELKRDGVPALMIIAGEDETTVTICNGVE